ncbi:DnaA-like protein [Chitinophaga skermanii]|uniref:DnaA-like protein n=1 Tax=Chitinophaga skermanii TaxID=331697 RepID=A0A327Q7I3_9BACT|nr:hypothetical protein [Chitinophaga skermanii]RAJ00459.1 DnaA-like protein [Chitinophaga skermanii]
MALITFQTATKPLEERLIDAACIYWDIDRATLFQKTEQALAVYRKGVVYYLIRNSTTLSYREIANLFGFRGHQPVMRLIDNIDANRRVIRQTACDIKEIESIAGKLESQIICCDVKLQTIYPDEKVHE